MTGYRLVVTREEPNPTYAEEQAEWEKRRSYYEPMGGGMGPSRTISRTVLDVTLTEAEYIAVKRGAIEAAQ